jgi:hypothetical protein
MVSAGPSGVNRAADALTTFACKVKIASGDDLSSFRKTLSGFSPHVAVAFPPVAEASTSVTSELDPLTPPTASDTSCGCHRSATGRFRRGVGHLLARAMGAPLWACAVLGALGLAAAFLLALH